MTQTATHATLHVDTANAAMPRTWVSPERVAAHERAALRDMLSRSWLAGGLLLTLVGGLWLLSALGYLPRINWVWVLSLAGLGVIPWVVAPINKFSFGLSAFFLSAAVHSALRQAGVMSTRVAMPSHVLTTGALVMLSMLLPIPLPAWLRESEKTPA